MSITFRKYTTEPLFTEDYIKVRNFLIRINLKELTNPHFTWARWEWMTTHGGLDRTAISKIGLWEENGEIVGLVTFDCSLGEGFFCVDEKHNALKEEMIVYASKNLAKDGKFHADIGDSDREFQRIATKNGFRPTQNRGVIAAIDIDDNISYSLPQGYSIISMADGWNFHKYHECMWRGFNHEGEPPQTEEDINCRIEMLSSPTIIPELVLAVTSPDGKYVAHCGMWYRPGDDYAYVEPVATVPEYRKMGLGKAAVLEAVKRCGKLGAKQAIVHSSQQFYFNIGFYPAYTETWWEAK